METVSDNEGRSRGRPRKYPRDDTGYLEEFVRYTNNPGYGEKILWSRRQQQNIVHAERAQRRLEEFASEAGSEHISDSPTFVEGVTPRGEFALGVSGGGWYPPQRVMTELGRILEGSEADEALFWRAVDWYARFNWSRGHADYVARWLRELRLGKRSALPSENES
jgi:hypothetical protein